MSHSIDSTTVFESQSATRASLSFSRTTGNTTIEGSSAGFALSKTSSVTVAIADNVQLSDSAKAFLTDLESGKIPDPGQGQSGNYTSLGMTINQSRTTSGPHSSDIATSTTTYYSVANGDSSFTVSVTESADAKFNSRLLLLGISSDSDDTVTITKSNESAVAATSTATPTQTSDATTKSSDPAVAALALLRQSGQMANDQAKTEKLDKLDLLSITRAIRMPARRSTPRSRGVERTQGMVRDEQDQESRRRQACHYQPHILIVGRRPISTRR